MCVCTVGYQQQPQAWPVNCRVTPNPAPHPGLWHTLGCLSGPGSATPAVGNPLTLTASEQRLLAWLYVV